MRCFSNKEFTLLDGATGSNLMAAGMPAGVCVEEWILQHEQVLSDLQQQYLDAGSQMVLAPTFGANRIKLAAYGLSDKTGQMNEALFALSAKVAGTSAAAGDLSPTSLFLKPAGDAQFSEILSVYREQISALKAAGAERIVAETQMTLSDVRAALIAAAEANLSVSVTVTVDRNGRTLSGMSLPVAAVTAQALGAEAVGLNCSTGPQSMVPFLHEAGQYTFLPLIAKPNAGDPGQAPLEPDAFAACMPALVQAGATVLGGCCGTGPAHIEAISKILPGLTPAERMIPKAEYLTNGRSVFSADPASFRLPDQPLDCTEDLADDLLDWCPEDGDGLLFSIRSPQDAALLAESFSLSACPIAVAAADTACLEQVLASCDGRVAVHPAGCQDPGLIKKYGALKL